jgi:hypothetical protein
MNTMNNSQISTEKHLQSDRVLKIDIIVRISKIYDRHLLLEHLSKKYQLFFNIIGVIYGDREDSYNWFDLQINGRLENRFFRT